MKTIEILNKQLETEHRIDAEKCIEVYNALSEINKGKVWESQWRVLTIARCSVFPTSPSTIKDNIYYVLSEIGEIFYKGLKAKED